MSEACCRAEITGEWSCEDLGICECFEAQGTPMGPGTRCEDYERLGSEGFPLCGLQACCSDAGCFNDTVTACEQEANGVAAGVGSNCNNYSCDQSIACCRLTIDGYPTCEQVATGSECFGGRGIPGTACNAANCEQFSSVTEACCKMGGTCDDITLRDCCAGGGRPLGLGTDCDSDRHECAPFDPPGCRGVRADRRAPNMFTGDNFLGTTADLCALSVLLPTTLTAQRGPQPVTTRPVRMQALSIQEADDQREACHLHTGELFDHGGRMAIMVCGMRVHDMEEHNPHRFKAFGGVVMLDNDQHKGHAFVVSHETPMWQEVQYHPLLRVCQGRIR